MVLAVDVGLAVVVALSLLAGLRNGLLDTVVSIAAWVGGILAGFHFAPGVLDLLPDWAQRIPGAEILAGVFLFLIAFALIRLVGSAMGIRTDRPIGPAERALGMLLGTVRGIVLAGVIASVLVAALPARSAIWTGSRALPVLAPIGEIIARWSPQALQERILNGWERLDRAPAGHPDDGYAA
ncbi:MAG: hypothetical protein GF346_04165 [Candidatus Eisenbacteria bacterium]|nr:hypothetical protein [Candidatus Latescibacterota bacterium]MBD3301621.1 hypothetical protein [Candidatus Eisenbacteria bacterium]